MMDSRFFLDFCFLVMDFFSLRDLELFQGFYSSGEDWNVSLEFFCEVDFLDSSSYLLGSTSFLDSSDLCLVPEFFLVSLGQEKICHQEVETCEKIHVIFYPYPVDLEFLVFSSFLLKIHF